MALGGDRRFFSLASIVADGVRRGVDVDAMTGFDEDDLFRDEIRAAGVGVIEGRDFGGGGPILPGTRSLPVGETTLARPVRASAGPLAVDGVSTPFKCFRPSSPVSEMTEDGRESDGVEKMLESRRWLGSFVGCTGVLPAVPRTPILRLSCRKFEHAGREKEPDTYQLKLLLFGIESNIKTFVIIVRGGDLLIRLNKLDFFIGALFLKLMDLSPEADNLVLESRELFSRRANLDIGLCLVFNCHVQLHFPFSSLIRGLLESTILFFDDSCVFPPHLVHFPAESIDFRVAFPEFATVVLEIGFSVA